jgi:hypothetical protein
MSLNIINPTEILGRTYANILSSSTYDYHTNPYVVLSNTNSDKVFKINSIIATNNTTTNNEVSIAIRDSNSGGVIAHIVKKLDIPPKSSQIISTKETYFYLEEDYKLAAAKTGDTSLLISYEVIST